MHGVSNGSELLSNVSLDNHLVGKLEKLHQVSGKRDTRREKKFHNTFMKLLTYEIYYLYVERRRLIEEAPKL